MPTPTLVKNPTEVRTGPGSFFISAANPVEPSWAAASSQFSNSVPGFYSGGYTASGLTFTFGARETTTLTPAEEYEPIRIVTTGIGSSTMGFDTYGINEQIFKYTMNGGTWSTVGGTGATLVRKYVPPDPGLETRASVIWISADRDEILWLPQVFQTGTPSRTFAKGDTTSGLKGVVFSTEKSATYGYSWAYLTAGAGYTGPAVTV